MSDMILAAQDAKISLACRPLKSIDLTVVVLPWISVCTMSLSPMAPCLVDRLERPAECYLTRTSQTYRDTRGKLVIVRKTPYYV